MKAKLRALFRERRDQLSIEEREQGNQQLVSRTLEVFDKVITQASMGVYYPQGSEASIQGLFKYPYRFYLPRIQDFSNARMGFYLTDFSNLEKNKWGIFEPPANAPLIDGLSLEILFIPLLAFDSKGGRLGQGKGFYDRYLDRFTGKRVGVAYDCQFFDGDLPMEEHDHCLDLVITPTATYLF
ncbi:MAG: 5-formyltetrahydrofolate cyclo-ligase [Oligoflexia bacterium]|nr:5-formyltetrahydrofolate cyclo-ligase [Oligoflexia bacterium]